MKQLDLALDSGHCNQSIDLLTSHLARLCCSDGETWKRAQLFASIKLHRVPTKCQLSVALPPARDVHDDPKCSFAVHAYKHSDAGIDLVFRNVAGESVPRNVAATILDSPLLPLLLFRRVHDFCVAAE